ncbi:MAG: hypothetical protein EA425_00170 [Puniceicoccaceae bacterium]|nr:MAG: hypothetical protein EA425_00170 [Puniceicoccaceae bacterium]
MSPPPNPVEACFLDLARRWSAAYRKLGPMETPKRETDLLALAALILANEHPHRLSPACHETIGQCRELGGNRFYYWVDRLPWQLAGDILRGERHESVGINIITQHLDEPKSALRGWALEVAWFVRADLDPESAVPKLLANVENTLAFVTASWGLAGALCGSKEALELEARLFQPEDFIDQYAKRCARFSEFDLVTCQARFWNLESLCRRIITDSMAHGGSPQTELPL